MRTQSMGGITIYYPDFMVYEGDNNYIRIKATGSDHTVLIATYGSATASYSSSGENVTVEVGSMFRQKGEYGAVSLSVYVSRNNSTYSNNLTLDFYYCHGRTVPTVYHGSGRRVVVPWFVSSVEVPVMAAAKVTLGSTSQTLAEGCITTVTLGERERTTAIVEYVEARMLGDFDAAESGVLAYFNIEHVSCLRDGEVFLRWYDSDGCTRYAVGRIMSRRHNADRVMYNVGGSVLRSEPYSVPANTSETLDIVVVGVDAALHLDELPWSESIELVNGENQSIPVSVEGEIAVSTRQVQDITLKIKTLV